MPNLRDALEAPSHGAPLSMQALRRVVCHQRPNTKVGLHSRVVFALCMAIVGRSDLAPVLDCVLRS